MMLFSLLSVLSALAAEPEIIIPTVPPSDQNDTLQCWAVAITSRYDFIAGRALGGPVKLSPRYTVYSKTLGEVTQLILSRRMKKYRGILCETCKPELIYYEQGGVLPDAVEAAKVFGVMPIEAYPDFPREDERLFRALNALIASYAGNPDRYELPRDELRERVTNEVKAVLNAFLGEPPRAFEFRGESYTPREFFAKAMPGWEDARARELNYNRRAPERPAPGYVSTFSGERYRKYTTSDHALLFDTLKKALKRGEPVLLQYITIDEDQTHAYGTIGFKSHGISPRRPEKNALEHYVLAVGARFDDSGNISEILVKNTWDTKPGPRWGYQWMQPDYFPLVDAVEIPD
jgi:hypothetical protein